MAQGLPFFKFEIDSYQNGNIQFCSYESQGLFINICTIYWSRQGDLKEAQVIQRLCNGNADALQELIQNDIIKKKDEKLVIEFLDEQLIERGAISDNAKKAANARWSKEKNTEESESNADAMRMHSESNANRIEQNRTEHNKKEEKQKGFIPILDLNYNHMWHSELSKIYNIGERACRNHFTDFQDYYMKHSQDTRPYDTWKDLFFKWISRNYTPKCPNPMLR